MLKVKGYRVSANLTRADCAKAIGVHVNTYALKEQGKTAFNIEEAFKLSQLLNCPLEAFKR